MPAAGDAVGHNAVLTPAGDAISIEFQPAAWPSAYWSAPVAQPWDWTGRGVLAFDLANPGPQSADFAVRIDDDTSADGIHHCHTSNGTIAAGGSGHFCVILDPPDSKADMGMNGGPPLSDGAGLTGLSGWGPVNLAHIVAFQIFMHSPPAPVTLTVSHLRLIESPSTADLYRGIVDPFGQFTRADWPGKLHSESDYGARRQEETADLAKHPEPADRDDYGGWESGPQLPATGFFYTQHRNGKWWLVTPSGHLFLSFGVDAIGMGDSTFVHPRDSLFTWLPAADDRLSRFYGTGTALYGPFKTGKTYNFYQANLARKYGDSYALYWRQSAVARLESWGFNTIGNWSDESLESMGIVPYTATLSIGGAHDRIASGSDYWGKMHDPYDPQFAVDCDNSLRDKAAHLKNDRYCIGYFVDNELSWVGGDVESGRYGLAYGALTAPAGEPAKLAFLGELHAKYATIGDLNAAWGTSLADWSVLDAPYTAPANPTAAQKRDMGAFVYAFAKQYFAIVRATLTKYDPNHLYLGCRFAGYTPEEVRAAGEICDVISFNNYAKRLDPDRWAFVADLHKPCIIGEFHCGALDRGMFHPGLVSAPNQAARAEIFSNYVESVIDNPSFVGAHWFEYVDEPLTGRYFDGENYNIGFVSVTDTPYPEMVTAARAVLGGMYESRAAGLK